MLQQKSQSSFVVVGDLCLAGPDIIAAFGERVRSPWKGLNEVIGPATPLIANLECAITNQSEGRPFKYANLRGSPDVAWILERLDLAVLGNNHISDFGPIGVSDTLRTLSQLGVVSAGYGTTIHDAIRPAILSLGPERLGVISLCCPTTNGENLATHISEGVASLGMALLREAVLAAKKLCDALLVYIHWGQEQVHDPVPEQIRLGRAAVDFGADAVVSCHAHVIQSYECYKGRWIFYGLGNFLFGRVPTLEVGSDARMRVGINEQLPRNRESLAVEFSVVPGTRGQRLRLGNIHALSYGSDFLPEPITRGQLTFDLDEANQQLLRYTSRHARELACEREPIYRAEVRNGILAYWYASAPIADITSFGLLKRFYRKGQRLALKARTLAGFRRQ